MAVDQKVGVELPFAIQAVPHCLYESVIEAREAGTRKLDLALREARRLGTRPDLQPAKTWESFLRSTRGAIVTHESTMFTLEGDITIRVVTSADRLRPMHVDVLYDGQVSPTLVLHADRAEQWEEQNPRFHLEVAQATTRLTLEAMSAIRDPARTHAAETLLGELGDWGRAVLEANDLAPDAQNDFHARAATPWSRAGVLHVNRFGTLRELDVPTGLRAPSAQGMALHHLTSGSLLMPLIHEMRAQS